MEEEFQHIFRDGCSYVTGSVARYEANEHSDLDVFIMAELPAEDGAHSLPLDSLEQAHLLSTVDRARHLVGFRKFSQGGRFLTCHSFKDMVSAIGSSEDDATNRFTARMLLLLNSRPLVNEAAYEQARRVVLDRYWRQQPDPEAPFYPVYLINDIRRWWSVLLLNFEYNNPPSPSDIDHEEGRLRRAKRRLNNLKLRYARLLAVYTPILGILAIAEPGGVRRSRMGEVIDPSPLDRLDIIRTQVEDQDAARLTTHLIEMYDRYLEYMSGPEEELLDKVLRDNWKGEVKAGAYEFGDKVAELMHRIGGQSEIYRYVVI